ncbi:hypothetical protein [Fulvitalea axinellae]|uniref:hypothetical protein n=1 Tax=Fulvitalea axinellae TaxID=1182444 RepID=UPI0030CA451C
MGIDLLALHMRSRSEKLHIQLRVVSATEERLDNLAITGFTDFVSGAIFSSRVKQLLWLALVCRILGIRKSEANFTPHGLVVMAFSRWKIAVRAFFRIVPHLFVALEAVEVDISGESLKFMLLEVIEHR